MATDFGPLLEEYDESEGHTYSMQATTGDINDLESVSIVTVSHHNGMPHDLRVTISAD